MNIVPYALMCYGLMAVISLIVIAIIVGVSKIMGESSEDEA
jgi:hypothetical protein